MAIRQHVGALFTDLYEVTMAQGLLGRKNVGHSGFRDILPQASAWQVLHHGRRAG